MSRIVHPAERDGWTRPSPKNAVWSIGENRWALGVHKICEVVAGDSIPQDSHASWLDNSGVRYCIRDRPLDMAKDFDETKIVPIAKCNSGSTIAHPGMAIYRLGEGVIVRAKKIGQGGNSNDALTLTMIREFKPKVPVPEPLYHWKDSNWFCYFTIMREIPGVEIYWVWWGLAEKHRKRLMLEAARHLQQVGEITCPLAISADGHSISGGGMMPSRFVDDEKEQCTIDFGPLTPKGLHDRLSRRVKIGYDYSVPDPEGKEWGTKFHLCQMDMQPEHFFVSDGEPVPPRATDDWWDPPVYSPERQERLHISGIIDWEKSGFFPRFMVSRQVIDVYGGALQTNNCPDIISKPSLPPPERAWDFTNSLVEALVEIGEQDPKTSEYQTTRAGWEEYKAWKTTQGK